MYTASHSVQFCKWREASTLQESNSNLSYLQGFVGWKYLTTAGGMLDVAETSLQWSALYYCLLFKASTNLGKKVGQFTKKSFEICQDIFRSQLLFLLMSALVLFC